MFRDGELVLMDAGCEYYGYASDITRTWPVNGRYTPAQRALYEAVLDVQKSIISATRANETLNHLHNLASNLLLQKLKGEILYCMKYHPLQLYFLLGLGILSERMGLVAIDKLFPHHVGHYLGMDVHDTMLVNRNISLAPNMVITCEPGIYIPRDYPVDQLQKANE